MTPAPDTLLFAFWTGITAGFCYLWATMLVAWFLHRDNRSLVYVLLLFQLSLITGINVIVRSAIFGLDPYTLVAIQRGIWGAALITAFAVVDIYSAAHRGKRPRVMRAWLYFRHQIDDGHGTGGLSERPTSTS